MGQFAKLAKIQVSGPPEGQRDHIATLISPTVSPLEVILNENIVRIGWYLNHRFFHLPKLFNVSLQLT